MAIYKSGFGVLDKLGRYSMSIMLLQEKLKWVGYVQGIDDFILYETLPK